MALDQFTRVRRSAIATWTWSSATWLGLVMAAVLHAPVADAQRGPIAFQYIDALYTEGLGRIPDQGGWRGKVDFLGANGCQAWTLQALGRDVYTSAEFMNLGYDNAAKVLSLYRGLLNREPDAGGYAGWLSYLDGGGDWSTVVEGFLGSGEFAGLVAGPYCNGSYYFYGTAAAIDIPTSGGGFGGGSGDDLQAILYATPPGGFVSIAQKAVVRVSQSLIIPAGVTLTTTGSPTPGQYALMGRLVRTVPFTDAVVRLESGAALRNVWVDGQRGDGGNFVSGAINVHLLGGNGTSVEDSKVSNTMGWSSLVAHGNGEGLPCAQAFIRRNLITAYSSDHYNGHWSDGLSISCENALVENNEITEATDVSIVLFRATGAVQRSQIRGNRILQAGHSAYGGIVADPLTTEVAPEHSFAGAVFDNNLMWSGSGHFDIAVSAGTRAWFPNFAVGRGVAFTNNTSGSESVIARIGIAVTGMFDAYVQSNVLSRPLAPPGNCPAVDVGASVSAGWASGDIQPYTDVDIVACIGH